LGLVRIAAQVLLLDLRDIVVVGVLQAATDRETQGQ
jgi:hypothetical protein